MPKKQYGIDQNTIFEAYLHLLNCLLLGYFILFIILDLFECFKKKQKNPQVLLRASQATDGDIFLYVYIYLHVLSFLLNMWANRIIAYRHIVINISMY